MVLFLKKDNLENLIEKIPNKLVVYSLSEKATKELTIQDKDLLASIPLDGMLPDHDDLKDLAEGNVSSKKLIKKLDNQFTKKKIKKAKDPTYLVQSYMFVTQLLNTIKNGKISVILMEDSMEKKDEKFLVTYFGKLLKKFGIGYMSETDKKDRKEIKKITKGKKKVVKKKINNLMRDVKVKDSETRALIKKYHNLTILTIALDDLSVIRKKSSRNKLKDNLMKEFTKSLGDKKLRKSYELLTDIDMDDISFPKSKKAKKKIKFSALIVAVKHMGLLKFGIDYGSQEYFKAMNKTMKYLELDGKFKDAVKKTTGK